MNRQTIGQKLRAYRRRPGSLILMLLVMLSAVATFAVLLFLIAYILIKGLPHLTPDLFALKYTSENASLMPALLNTIGMTALSLVIAVPLGIFAAIFLVEYAKRGNKFVEIIRLTTERVGNPVDCLRIIRIVVFRNNTRLGIFSTCGGIYIGNHDSSTDHPNNRGSIKISSR